MLEIPVHFSWFTLIGYLLRLRDLLETHSLQCRSLRVSKG